MYAARSLEDEVSRGELFRSRAVVVRRRNHERRGSRRADSHAPAKGEARLHVLAQLVGVIGQPQQIEIRHRARVQTRVTHRQPV